MPGFIAASVWAQAFVDQAESPSNSPSVVGQLAAGLAGLLAVPVVVWSEYTLKTTGEPTCQAARFSNRLAMLVHAAHMICTVMG